MYYIYSTVFTIQYTCKFYGDICIKNHLKTHRKKSLSNSLQEKNSRSHTGGSLRLFKETFRTNYCLKTTLPVCKPTSTGRGWVPKPSLSSDRSPGDPTAGDFPSPFSLCSHYHRHWHKPKTFPKSNTSREGSYTSGFQNKTRIHKSLMRNS